MIKVGKPYIKNKDNKSRLCSLIEIDDENIEMYYEVDNKYEKYLCKERADSFIVALLHLAMDKNQDIKSEAPISPQLHYHLIDHIIPTFAKYLYNKKINIISNLDFDIVPKGEAVGTGLSSGVDSFHTILSHIELENSDFNLSHVTFLNVGSHGIGKKAHKLYKERLIHSREVSKVLGLELIEIDSNIPEIMERGFIETHTFRSFSAILALQDLFSKYYYASGYPLDEFKINKNATSASYDLLSSFYLSTENIDFYSFGIETSRLEKTEYISENKIAQKNLNVCFRDESNCGECEKCIRTQLGLYSIGKLHLYGEVFDLENFDSKLNSHLGYMLANQNNNNYKEIKNMISKNKIKISPVAYIFFIKHKPKNLLLKPKNFLRKKLRKSDKLTNLVRKIRNN